jgi:D-serine deaminase-like pyridoxal phosphate-dependent protein
MAPAALYARYTSALGDEPLPCALVDLDALDRNIDSLLEPVRAHHKKLRLATKSVRCPELLRHITERGGDAISGLMTYHARETAWLFEAGYHDLLLAYPTVQASDAALLADINARGGSAAVVVDCPQHLALLDKAARAKQTRIPIVVEVDVAYRPLGARLHVGVRRSPLRRVDDVQALVRRAELLPGLEMRGLMAYEAHIAGLGDSAPGARLSNAATRLMKTRARAQVEQTRRELADAIRPALFNGGGSGSLDWCSAESALTEVTAGSGFLCSHLFDNYRSLQLAPAAYFALSVVRAPADGIVTCHGGGLVASGAAGADRLPIPALPPGLELLPLEGAGEVQTPLSVPEGTSLAVGDVVFFRHAKAGELAEHFNEYLLVRGERVLGRAQTYRGMRQCFLG